MKRLAENRMNWGRKSNRKMQDIWPLKVTFEGDTGLTQRIEREKDTEAVDKFNKAVRLWGQRVKADLKRSTASSMGQFDHLNKSMKVNYRHYGKRVPEGKEITSLGFAFAEEGLFVHIGVGRGYGYEAGHTYVKKDSDDEMRRFPNPWFNPVIEQHIPELQQIVHEYCGDLLVNSDRIYINR